MVSFPYLKRAILWWIGKGAGAEAEAEADADAEVFQVFPRIFQLDWGRDRRRRGEGEVMGCEILGKSTLILIRHR